MERLEARKEAERWLRRLGIEQSRWQASPVTLGSGEQQRFNLARALIAHQHFLLLDEPTASFDAISKSIVLEMICEAREASVTILTISRFMLLCNLLPIIYTGEKPKERQLCKL